MATAFAKPQDIQREYWLVDLSGQTVGRAASRIATILRGKHKPTFTPHADTGDFVICINADKIHFTGRKLDSKSYHRVTGFPGNTKHWTARQLLATKPEQVITLAVRGMLPRGSLGRTTLSKLKVYAGTEHPHAAQRPKPLDLSPATKK